MQKERIFKGIIFDFDGTLAKLNINFKLMKRKIDEVAKVFLDEEVKTDSLSALEAIEVYAQVLKRQNPEDELEFLSRCRLRITAVEMKAAQKGGLFSYTLPVLKRLKERKILIGIITRNCTAAVKTVFPEVEKYSQILLCREDVPRVKPDPEHLKKAIKGLQLEKEQVLMVGDHLLDVKTAKGAEVKAAAIATGNMSLEELSSSGPEYISRDLPELMDKLEGLGCLGG